VNDYEMVYVLSPRLSSDEGEQASKWVEGIIRENGGELLSTDLWGRRRLAYPIKHQFEGTYVYTTFRLDPSATVRVESQLGLSENVLRHLIIRGIVEGGMPEAQSARLMAANRPPVAPPPPDPAAAPATDEAAGEATAEAADAASETPAEVATPSAEAGDAASEAPVETATLSAEAGDAASEAPVEAGAAEAAAEASSEAAAATADGEATDASAPAEPEPARVE